MGHRVVEIFVVVSSREVLAGMRTARLFTMRGGDGEDLGDFDHVGEFHRRDEFGIENLALILESLPGVSVIVTGGTVRPLQHSLVAPMGTLLLDQLKADVAFLGCNGVDPTRGFTNTNIAEAEIKQAMVRSATKTVFLADHDKIGQVASAFVADISGADLLITDDGAEASVLSNLEGDGLSIEVVRLRGI